MRIQTKRSKFVFITIAIMAGVFLPNTLAQEDNATVKITEIEPVPAKEIYGVQCRLLPEKEKWQTSEVPEFKAYIPGPGHEDLWLATIVQQGCRIQIDGQWYRYIGPEWTSDVGGHTLSDWIANAGGFLSVSLDQGNWVTLHDFEPPVLAPGEHTVDLGWAGYKVDPTGESDREDNPILLVSEPVIIQIIESEEPVPGVTPGEERHQQVMKLFDIFLQKEPLTEAEQELGIRTDLRLFYNWRPKFTWEDIPALLELAGDDELLDGMPSLAISSYIGRHCRKGMIALWFIEGLRREQITQTREEQLQEKLHVGLGRLPLNPICVKEDMDLSECEQSAEIHMAVLHAYSQWWGMVESLPAGQAAAFYPLDLTDMEWYGAGDRWRDQPLEIYENISSDGMAAKRAVRQWKWNEGEYQPGKIMQTIYYTLINPENPPFIPDMLKIRKIVLHYYNDLGEQIRTVDILPGEFLF